MKENLLLLKVLLGRTLQNKIFRHMTAVSKNVYFDVLDNIVDKYNNTYHKTTIKMTKKAELKNATGVDTFKLAATSDLASLKAEVDEIDVDKLKTVPFDLRKLSNVVNNDVVKKTLYYKLVAKVDNIDTSGFVLKTKYDTDKSNLEKKILTLVDLLKK